MVRLLERDQVSFVYPSTNKLTIDFLWNIIIIVWMWNPNFHISYSGLEDTRGEPQNFYLRP